METFFLILGIVIASIIGIAVTFIIFKLEATKLLNPKLMKRATPNQIRQCIRAGANIHAKNKYGSTVLMCAAGKSENPEVISTLIQAGAKINTQTQHGYTALDFAEERTESQAKDEIIFLLHTAGAKNGKEL